MNSILTGQALDLIGRLTESETKSLSDMALKLTEELGELTSELLKKSGAVSYKPSEKFAAIEEALDVLMVAASIVKKLQHEDSVTDNQVRHLLETKLAKWEKIQTLDTQNKTC